jgi:hypothetical protein
LAPSLVHPLCLNERDKLLVDPNAVVGEFTLHLVLGREVRVLVVAEDVAQEVGHQEPRIPLIRVPVPDIGQRLGKASNTSLQALSDRALPLWAAAPWFHGVGRGEFLSGCGLSDDDTRFRRHGSANLLHSPNLPEAPGAKHRRVANASHGVASLASRVVLRR